MAGTFSMIQISSASIAAGIIATAAFFAPLTVTSPQRRQPPLITNFSKENRHSSPSIISIFKQNRFLQTYETKYLQKRKILKNYTSHIITHQTEKRKSFFDLFYYKTVTIWGKLLKFGNKTHYTVVFKSSPCRVNSSFSRVTSAALICS